MAGLSGGAPSGAAPAGGEFAEALTRAAAAGKPVLIDFYTDW
jgi:hypothetical protein